MGRMLQKKKNRSSVPRATQKPKSKRLPIKASPLVAAKWDKHLTLSQNYRRLGLTSKLNARTGGTEVKATDNLGEETQSREDALAVAASKPAITTGLKTAKVVRDEQGRILKVVHDETIIWNPLNDHLLAKDEGSDAHKSSNHTNHEKMNHAGVVPELEAAARAELAVIAGKKKPRKQSHREREWIEQLVTKYGQDTRSMSMDPKLNPNQQTEADINRRVEIWQNSK